ncbi:MAG: NUDIX hydrolase [Clostridiales bacterium]|nr:NUDIX hydrolase [Clostridiales bacterium]
MIEAVSCGGVVIYKWKILVLYKNQNGKYVGWVLPKGTVEQGETFKETAIREVKEESGADGHILKYIGKTHYVFRGSEDMVSKTVHWYLMSADSFFCKPQAEEFFVDAGFYKFHEAFHLLKFNDERNMLKRAYFEYAEIKKSKEIARKNFFSFYR